MSSLSQFFSGGPKVWVSGTTYSIGNVVLSPADNYQQYVRITNGAGTTDPSSDTTNYRPHGGRGVKSIQSGYVSSTSMTTGTGEDTTYVNVTISSVNISKSIVYFTGGASGDTGNAIMRNADGVYSTDCFPRLVDSTTLRLSSPRPGVGAIVGRWTVKEYE